MRHYFNSCTVVARCCSGSHGEQSFYPIVLRYRGVVDYCNARFFCSGLRKGSFIMVMGETLLFEQETKNSKKTCAWILVFMSIARKSRPSLFLANHDVEYRGLFTSRAHIYVNFVHDERLSSFLCSFVFFVFFRRSFFKTVFFHCFRGEDCFNASLTVFRSFFSCFLRINTRSWKPGRARCSTLGTATASWAV